MADHRRGQSQADHDARQQGHHRHQRPREFSVGDEEQDENQHQREDRRENHVLLALLELVIEQYRLPGHPHGDVGKLRFRFLDHLAHPLDHARERGRALLLLHAGPEQHQDRFAVFAEAEILVFEKIRLKF